MSAVAAETMWPLAFLKINIIISIIIIIIIIIMSTWKRPPAAS